MYPKHLPISAKQKELRGYEPQTKLEDGFEKILRLVFWKMKSC
jgi:hypothetical protein